jgi:DNA-binding beta-propeller fold protein YncE
MVKGFGRVALGVALFALGISEGPSTALGPGPRALAAGGPAGSGTGQLVAYESLDTCLMPGGASLRRSAFGQEGGRPAASPGVGPAAFVDPLRTIRDPYPAFAAIAVDMQRDEVVVTDENLFQVLVYDRMENTPAGAPSRPKRTIAGPRTNIEFQSGVYVDQRTGDIYAANNDTRDTLVVFAQGASGDVEPIREMETPHGTFGVTIVEAHGELFMTEQHDSSIVVYRKDATKEESPIRHLQGGDTGLADPHGLAYDPSEDVIFVANYGSTHGVAFTDRPKTGVNQAVNRIGKESWPLGREFAVPGSGRIHEPSITVYARTARRNARPLRTIQGRATRLNWPTGLAFDPQARELFVANDAAHEILVFDASARGDAAPKRVLAGPRTKLANPTGVFADTKNRELWVANFGGHSATVYDLSAGADTPPKRIIRNAPEDAPSLMIGNPGAVGYDSRRAEILVPN